MDGLIVKMPFARRLVRGIKKREFRSTGLPKSKMKKVYILNNGNILGTVVFYYEKRFGKKSYEWYVRDPKEFDPPKKYLRKNGCVIWQNNIQILK